MKERVAVFIDGPYIYYATRHNNVEVDYKKLVDFLFGDRELVQVNFYTTVPKEEDIENNTPEWESYLRQKEFLGKLSLLGFEVIVTTLIKQFSGEYKEKGFDINLSSDMLMLAYENKYDTGILVSGDGDFIPAVRKVKQLGKRIEIAAFVRNCSSELRNVCDKFTPLDDYIDRFRYLH